MSGRPPPQDLAAATLSHYQEHALAYRAGTADHDVRQNVDALLRAIRATPPYAILDLGCGPGRDLCTFTRLGHLAVGLDGAPAMVALARAASGCEVWQQNLIALDLPVERFDGIFANAVLFHVPAEVVGDVLGALWRALRPQGVLFCSNPHGDNQEGCHGTRYGCYYDLATWRGRMAQAGFEEIEHYYRPTGLPRERQPWLASVWRKLAGAGPLAPG